MSQAAISIIKIALAVTCFVFSAQLTYDLQLGEINIPLTAQSLVILGWAVFLRPLESVIAVLTYIAIGVYGLPVFANGASGHEVIEGPTGGYLVGFILGAMVVSWIRDPYRRETILSVFLLMLVGTVIILICGIIRLSILYGLEKSLESGFYALWKGALIKIVVGAILTYIIHLIVRAINPPQKKGA